jgi:hypothetical protein
MNFTNNLYNALFFIFFFLQIQSLDINAQVGVGAEPPLYAELMMDGSRAMLEAKWEYWEGPRYSATYPIKWQVVKDPITCNTVVSSNDPTAAGGLYGAADIVTKKKYRDFRAHVEFLIKGEGGNSGVYMQNRYEIQVLDGDDTPHGLGAIINESESPYYAYYGLGQWNAYDIVFKAARFEDGKLIEKPRATLYFNGIKAHTDFEIQQVWGGPNSGLDGGNDKGKGITDRPGGLKLQAEGHDVFYRNIWIQELSLDSRSSDF